MDSYFTISVSEDKLEALINIKDGIEELDNFVENDVLSFLKENKICYGINHDNLLKMLENQAIFQYPLVIANGLSPINGQNGYLISEIMNDNQIIVDEEKSLNFRNMLKIPSVKKGDQIAKIIPPTNGIDGVDVFGNEVKAKSGMPFKLKKGKNIEVVENDIFATIDGQLSINGTFVDVFPIFEVNESLDLKVGNIDFIGNVIIRGDVPDGYQIKAGGDIKILGIVEGSTLIADGSIYILGGIIGGNQGRIEAKGNIHSAYINKAVVNAGLDLDVNGAILHSDCSAGGKIISKSGSIIGGSISAGKSIIACEIGSRVYARTDLYVGINKEKIKREEEIQKELNICSDNFRKINSFMLKISQKYKTNGALTQQEIELLKKQKVIREQLENESKQLNEELLELQERSDFLTETEIQIKEKIYPNVQLNFGKYRYITENEQKHIKYNYEHGEIISNALK